MADEEILRLLSRLFPERAGHGFNILDYLHAEGSPAIALVYARLFWPEFTEFEGMVFLKETVEDDDDRERIRQTLARNAGDKSKTERSFNCHDFEELFGSRLSDATTNECRLLAEKLCEMWRARLESLWPTQSFRVDVVQPEPSEESIGLAFWRE